MNDPAYKEYSITAVLPLLHTNLFEVLDCFMQAAVANKLVINKIAVDMQYGKTHEESTRKFTMLFMTTSTEVAKKATAVIDFAIAEYMKTVEVTKRLKEAVTATKH